MEIFGEKNEPRFLLNALHFIKRNENEKAKEFNKNFRDIVSSMDDEFKPHDKSILVYYTKEISGEMRYQLRGKEPADIKAAQALDIKIDENMQVSGKSNFLGFTRGQAKQESKGKDPMQGI